MRIPLPIEAGQTISQPYIVARMIELLELKPTDKVLEVGAGSGCAAAVLSRIASKVYAIEPVRCSPVGRARGQAARLHQCGPKVPEALKLQLTIGGRLVIRSAAVPRRCCSSAVSTMTSSRRDHGAVTFVPLIGAEGWARRAAAGLQCRRGPRHPHRAQPSIAEAADRSAISTSSPA